jgi:hypothetical protein
LRDIPSALAVQLVSAEGFGSPAAASKQPVADPLLAGRRLQPLEEWFAAAFDQCLQLQAEPHKFACAMSPALLVSEYDVPPAER